MNEKLMEETYNLSIINKENNFTEGGPFGALIADKNGNIIATGKNNAIKSCDPTAHAEVIAIRNACKKLETHDLKDYILYTSCYPCPMCLSAAIWANIETIYYGNTKEDAEKIGFRDKKIYEFLNGENNILNLQQERREITIKAFQEFENNKDKIIY